MIGLLLEDMHKRIYTVVQIQSDANTVMVRLCGPVLHPPFICFKSQYWYNSSSTAQQHAFSEYLYSAIIASALRCNNVRTVRS